MAIDLTKGAALVTSDGTSTGQPIDKATFTIGWTASTQGKKGLFGGIKKLQGVDLDVIVIGLDANMQAIGYASGYDNKTPFRGALTHTGDKKRGGAGESVNADLKALPGQVKYLVCGLVAFKPGTSFGQVNDAIFEMTNANGSPIIDELYLGIENNFTVAIMATLKRNDDGTWQITPQSKFGNGNDYKDVAQLARQILA